MSQARQPVPPPPRSSPPRASAPNPTPTPDQLDWQENQNALTKRASFLAITAYVVVVALVVAVICGWFYLRR